MLIQSRRSFLKGLGLAVAAPAIVRASSLMAVKPFDELIPQLTPLTNNMPLANEYRVIETAASGGKGGGMIVKAIRETVDSCRTHIVTLTLPQSHGLEPGDIIMVSERRSSLLFGPLPNV